MKNMKRKNLLIGLSRIFKDNGYTFFLDGLSARLLYLGKSPEELSAWSDADLIFIASHFDDFSSGELSPYSARFTFGGKEILISCNPRFFGINKNRQAVTAANRFDFSIDMLLYDPLSDKFLDPLNKRELLRKGLLELNDGVEISFDTLIKATILESQGYKTLKEMINILQGRASQLLTASDNGTIRKGLSMVLECRNPYIALARLDRLGVLCAMIPELEALKGCPQDKDFHPEGDVFVHTLECFRHLKAPPLSLGLAMLLHDIAKPQTLAFGKNIHFPDHSTVGARIAARILRRLEYDTGVIEEAVFYIRHHLVGQLFRRLPGERLRELVTDPLFDNLLRLYKADIMGSMAPLGNYRRVVKAAMAIRTANGIHSGHLKAAL